MSPPLHSPPTDPGDMPSALERIVFILATVIGATLLLTFCQGPA
jgi:hypothetical protein